MKIHLLSLLRWGLLASLITSVSVSAASAENSETQSILERLEDGVAIRNKPLLHQGRFAITPMMGLSAGDLFQRTLLFGAQGEYFITDRLSISAGISIGIASELPLSAAIQQQRPDRVSSQSFSHIGLIAGGELQYAPIYGKFSLLGVNALRYDMHGIGGVGAVQTSGEVLESFAVAPVVGAGLRIFLTQELAALVQMRGYFYERGENATVRLQTDGSRRFVGESDYQVHPVVSFAVSYFFGKVRISD